MIMVGSVSAMRDNGALVAGRDHPDNTAIMGIWAIGLGCIELVAAFRLPRSSQAGGYWCSSRSSPSG